MDHNSNLSINNMMEFAMSLSMASLFTKAMTSACETTVRGAVQANLTQPKYIYAIIGGQQKGPFSTGDIITLIQSGDITPDSYIWKQGMVAWKPAKEITDISQTFDKDESPAAGQIPDVITPDLSDK